MTQFECVPNFSEGRDAERIERIVAPARTTPGVTVLDVERNADHNRSVVSLVGEGDALLEAVFQMVAVATREIDLNVQRGEHPRIGATDVIPFVPLAGSTMVDAVRLAERLGARVAKELGIPVYLYAAAAKRLSDPTSRSSARVSSRGYAGRSGPTRRAPPTSVRRSSTPRQGRSRSGLARS